MNSNHPAADMRTSTARCPWGLSVVTGDGIAACCRCTRANQGHALSTVCAARSDHFSMVNAGVGVATTSCSDDVLAMHMRFEDACASSGDESELQSDTSDSEYGDDDPYASRTPPRVATDASACATPWSAASGCRPAPQDTTRATGGHTVACGTPPFVPAVWRALRLELDHGECADDADGFGHTASGGYASSDSDGSTSSSGGYTSLYWQPRPRPGTPQPAELTAEDHGTCSGASAHGAARALSAPDSAPSSPTGLLKTLYTSWGGGAWSAAADARSESTTASSDDEDWL